MSKGFLLDVNVLVAFTSVEHECHGMANRWFRSQRNAKWGVCPLTEAGFMRLATNPNTRLGMGNFPKALAVLSNLARKPGYCYWPIHDSWATLTAQFADRIFGHQQVTDAYLLGLAIQEDGVLVTFDKAILHLAAEHRNQVLLLPSA